MKTILLYVRCIFFTIQINIQSTSAALLEADSVETLEQPKDKRGCQRCKLLVLSFFKANCLFFNNTIKEIS